MNAKGARGGGGIVGQESRGKSRGEGKTWGSKFPGGCGIYGVAVLNWNFTFSFGYSLTLGVGYIYEIYPQPMKS